MKKFWIVAIAVLLAGCGVNATVVDQEQAKPLSSLEAKRAKAALKGMSKPKRGWANAVVLAKGERGTDWFRVYTDEGVVVLTECMESSFVFEKLAVGDAIRWALAGDDEAVCEHEVKVLDISVLD